MTFTQFGLYRKRCTAQSTPECITAESAVMSHRHTAGPEGRRRTTSAGRRNRCQYPELKRFLVSGGTTVLRRTNNRTGSTNPVRVLSRLSSFGCFLHFMTLQTKTSLHQKKNHQSETKWDGTFVWLNVDMNKYSSFLKNMWLFLYFAEGIQTFDLRISIFCRYMNIFYHITSWKAAEVTICVHFLPLRTLHLCLCRLIPTRRSWTTVFAFWYGERPVLLLLLLLLVYFLVCSWTFTWRLFFYSS